MTTNSLNLNDVSRLAQLAKLQFNPATAEQLLNQMNAFFSIVEQMQAVDTAGVEPLSTPLAASLPLLEQVADLRLRDDAADIAPHNAERMTQHLRNAPNATEGLFLVPPVIE